MDDDENNGPDLLPDELADVIADESEGTDKAEKADTGAEGTDNPAEGDEGDGAEGAGSEKPDGEGSEGDEPKDEDEDKPARKRSGSQRLQRRLAAAEAEIAALRSRVAPDGSVSRQAVEAEIGPPPREQDFHGDLAAYDRAMTVYEIEARQTVRDMKAKAQSAQTARAEALREAAEEHMERCEAFAREVPDFKATLEKNAHLKASPIIETLVLESEQSPHLLYFLAKNPDRLEKLNRMSERDAAREVGRIESSLSRPKPKTETKAPTPKQPPKGGATPRSPDSDLNAWLTKTYGKR